MQSTQLKIDVAYLMLILLASCGIIDIGNPGDDHTVQTQSYELNDMRSTGNSDTSAECKDNQAPIAKIQISRIPGSGNGLAFDFNALNSSDLDGSLVSYFWEFGDGATAVEPTASHAYAQYGTYRIRLTVTDNCNAIAVETLDFGTSTALQ